MTNAVSEALLRHFATHTFRQLSATTSVLAIGLLLVVIAEREILRATSPEARRNFTAFGIVVLPMVAVFAAVIISRFFEFS